MMIKMMINIIIFIVQQRHCHNVTYKVLPSMQAISAMNVMLSGLPGETLTLITSGMDTLKVAVPFSSVFP